MLIAIDGVSAAGKNTLIQELFIAFNGEGREVYDITPTLAEPFSFDYLLKCLIQDTPALIDPTEEFLLYATRLAHKARLARELDCQQRIVLVDRYHHSLIVLAHHVRRIPRKQVITVAQVATKNYWPHASIFLDIDYEEHIRRGGTARSTRATAEGRKHFESTRDGFRAEFAVEKEPKLWLNTQSLSLAHCVQRASNMIKDLLTR
jgi:thymidylate kinase